MNIPETFVGIGFVIAGILVMLLNLSNNIIILFGLVLFVIGLVLILHAVIFDDTTQFSKRDQ
jgi:hypothetical protein